MGLIVDYLFIAAGGAAGSLVRFGLSQLLPSAPMSVPWATLGVNLIGSLALGYFSRAGLLGHRQLLFLVVGFLGSLTTFSTLAFEIADRASQGSSGLAAGYCAATLVFGTVAAWIGSEIALKQNPRGQR